MPVVTCVAKMEMQGITFNNEDILASKRLMNERLAELQLEADRVCNKHIKLSSIHEVRKYIFDELKLKAVRASL